MNSVRVIERDSIGRKIGVVQVEVGDIVTSVAIAGQWKVTGVGEVEADGHAILHVARPDDVHAKTQLKSDTVLVVTKTRV